MLAIAPNGDRTTTTWGYENKTTLVQLPAGICNTMAYNPDGLRVQLDDSQGTTKFLWDGQAYLAEADETNALKAVFTQESSIYGNLLSQYRKDGALWLPSYYHQDALGSTMQITDGNEVVIDTYLYDAWGEQLSRTGSTTNPFQYTGNVGYYTDPDTGNPYIRARIYIPSLGRWMSVDPLRFIDGMNLYCGYSIPNYTDAAGTAVQVDRVGEIFQSLAQISTPRFSGVFP